MVIFFLLAFKFFLFATTSRLAASIEFSSKQSVLNVTSNASLIVTGTGFSGVMGTVNLAPGANISGNTIIFQDGILGDISNSPIQISGSFAIDASITPATETNLGGCYINFFGNSSVLLKQDSSLTNTWQFTADSSIEGNFSFDLQSNGQIIIGSGTTLSLMNVTLQNFSMKKITFLDATSTLRMVNATVSVSNDIGCAVGNFIVVGDSKFILNQHDVLFTSAATFTVLPGSSLWLDNRGTTAAPIFSYVATDTSSISGVKLVSVIDNSLVRILTDKSQVTDPGVSNLISSIPQSLNTTDTSNTSTLITTATAVVVDNTPPMVVNVSANSTISAQDKIVVTSNTRIEGTGNSITFTNTGQAQVVVQPGKSVSFVNMELLRINQKTFSMYPGAVIKFENTTVLEFVEDVSYDCGTIMIQGLQSQVLLRGLGGRKRITFTSNANGYSAGLMIGTNNLILEDIEISGLEHCSVSKTTVNNITYEGQMVLTGQSRVNIAYDTEMNFLIQGDLCKLSLQNNNLSLNGKIRFANYMDSTLKIGFNFSSDVDNLVFALGRNSLLLKCIDGQCGVMIDNDVVTIINKSPTSFVTNGKSFLGGGTINIAQNPIYQETLGFSLLPGVDLQSSLAFPINFLNTTDAVSGKNFFDEFGIRNLDFGRALPSPSLVVRTSFVGTNLARNVAVRPGAVVKGFKPSSTDRLNLMLLGNSAVETVIRRAGQVSLTARGNSASNSGSSDNIDTIKAGDTIYVSGVNNQITVTGLLEIYGTIKLDEGAELIFKFDDSVDSPKAIRFASANGFPTLNLPPSSSIIFQGKGAVFFDNYMVCSFLGTPLEQQTPLGNGLYVDDRPSLIFKNLAQFVVDSEKTTISFTGRGKMLFQNNADLLLEAGSLLWGIDEGDFLDLTFDQGSSLTTGIIDNTTTINARLSLSQGLFNLKFDRSSTLAIENGSIIEIGLYEGTFTGGQLNSVLFDHGSKLISFVNGTLAFGQNSLTPSDNSAAKFSWNSLNSSMSAAGTVDMYVKGSESPFISAYMQNQVFSSSAAGLSPFEVFKKLAQETNTLIVACNYLDAADNNLKLITKNNVIITLAEGDIIRREGSGTGNVYGTAASGQRFAISPDGVKTFYS